jgi:glutamyl-tRNA reductase
VEQNRAERLQEAEKAERMVVEEVGAIIEWMKSLEVTPTIVALRHRVDDIKRAEVDKALGRLGHLSQQDKELVENLASAIVNKLIHRTMVTLKSEVNSSNGPAFVEAARRFFHLDQSSLEGPEAGRCSDRTKYLDPVSEESEHQEQESPLHKRSR